MPDTVTVVVAGRRGMGAVSGRSADSRAHRAAADGPDHCAGPAIARRRDCAADEGASPRADGSTSDLIVLMLAPTAGLRLGGAGEDEGGNARD